MYTIYKNMTDNTIDGHDQMKNLNFYDTNRILKKNNYMILKLLLINKIWQVFLLKTNCKLI